MELKSRPDEYDLREPELNSLGHQLLQDRSIKEAIQVFAWNVEAYPKSANVYDSLAQAYAEAGEKEEAVRNYAKALELNPKNVNAVEKLRKIVEKK
jgi:predicted Zn-dependent protease